MNKIKSGTGFGKDSGVTTSDRPEIAKLTSTYGVSPQKINKLLESLGDLPYDSIEQALSAFLESGKSISDFIRDETQATQAQAQASQAQAQVSQAQAQVSQAQVSAMDLVAPGFRGVKNLVEGVACNADSFARQGGEAIADVVNGMPERCLAYASQRIAEGNSVRGSVGEVARAAATFRFSLPGGPESAHFGANCLPPSAESNQGVAGALPAASSSTTRSSEGQQDDV